jgi:hypothetical protein
MSETSTSPSSQRRPQGALGLLHRLWRMASSVSLCVVLLVWLTILTLLGTFSQTKIGLYDSQAKYFDSLFFREEVFGIPLYLPGAYLVLAILFVNLLLGGLIRLRKKPKNIGVFLSHCSILLLIVAGWRSFHAKKEGHMALFPNEKSDLVQAYQDWQLEVREQGSSEALVIRDSNFSDCSGGKSRTFFRNALPFTLKVSEYARNCEIVEEGHPDLPATATRLDRFAILPGKTLPTNEANIAGLVLEINDASSNELLSKAVLGAVQRGPGQPERPPVVVKVKDKTYAIELTRERWKVPFQVKLDKFNLEKYEGTEKAKSYQSDVTKSDASGEEKIRIQMNEPMRRAGYVFFQASFGKVAETAPYYTVFAVVNNPSDQWPTYACVLSGIGLCLHFLIKLASFLSRTARSRAITSAPPVV